MSSAFKILFYLRKNHINKSGKSAIMIRISVNGDRTAFSSKLEVDPKAWDTKLSKIKGRHREAVEINNQIDEMHANIRVVFNRISKEDGYVTAEKVKNEFLGYTTKQQTILTLFEQHNTDMQKLVGVSKSQNTVYHISRYERNQTVPSIDVVKKFADLLEVTTDMLVYGGEDEKAKDKITDNELLTMFSKAQALGEEDRKCVKSFLKAFLFQKDMQQQLA
ncbi:MAG: helix-turn-helix domain-containing protein [Mangrovibacterium sp.]